MSALSIRGASPRVNVSLAITSAASVASAANYTEQCHAHVSRATAHSVQTRVICCTAAHAFSGSRTRPVLLPGRVSGSSFRHSREIFAADKMRKRKKTLSSSLAAVSDLNHLYICFLFTARRYAYKRGTSHRPLSVCLSVCHTRVVYRNG